MAILNLFCFEMKKEAHVAPPGLEASRQVGGFRTAVSRSC